LCQTKIIINLFLLYVGNFKTIRRQYPLYSLRGAAALSKQNESPASGDSFCLKRTNGEAV